MMCRPLVLGVAPKSSRLGTVVNVAGIVGRSVECDLGRLR